MIIIECPLCAGEATTDEGLSAVTCNGCGVTVEVAPDPAIALDVAA
jgi:Pyruvate/2-oxoacid:ferredoxin oxidoreductase delta subunit